MNQKGLTADDVVGLLAAIITESGGNTNDYFLSFSNVHDKKTKKTREIAKEVKEEWVAPDAPILHWDEKKITRHEKEEIRMPVLVSGDERPPRLLGSFKLENGKSLTSHALTLMRSYTGL